MDQQTSRKSWDANWAGGRKLKVLYVITQAIRGGAQTHLLDLATGMQMACEVHLACGEEGYLTEACRKLGIAVYIIPRLRRSGNIYSDLVAFAHTRRLLAVTKPDIVHVHTFKAGFIGRLAAWTLNIPVVYTIHAWLWGTDAISKRASMLAIPLERMASRWCSKIITVSGAGAKLLQAHKLADPAKNATIRNGIASRPIRKSPPRATPVITMVARFAAGKDFEQLIRAFAPISSRAMLRLVGDGETRPRMEELVRSLCLCERVEFLGERQDVPEILEGSDIFALASETEMLPISILEAMRAGIAVVASDVGGVSESFEDGVSGILVPKNDTNSFSEALAYLIDNPEERTRMGVAGRRLFESEFECGVMQIKTYLLYLDVLHAQVAEVSSATQSIQLAEAPQSSLVNLPVSK